MKTLLTIFALLLAMTGHANDWNRLWIGCQQTDPTHQVWFQRTYTLLQRPTEAYVEMASSGRFILYINGYNVTTSLLEPLDERRGDTIGVVRYEVTPFLRRGDNELKVWFSPMRDDPRQLSLQMYGMMGGMPF